METPGVGGGVCTEWTSGRGEDGRRVDRPLQPVCYDQTVWTLRFCLALALSSLVKVCRVGATTFTSVNIDYRGVCLTWVILMSQHIRRSLLWHAGI